MGRHSVSNAWSVHYLSSSMLDVLMDKFRPVNLFVQNIAVFVTSVSHDMISTFYIRNVIFN